MKKKGLAVFDLDGTITHKDTFLEFIRFVHGSAKLYLGLIWHLLFIGLFYLKLKNKKDGILIETLKDLLANYLRWLNNNHFLGGKYI